MVSEDSSPEQAELQGNNVDRQSELILLHHIGHCFDYLHQTIMCHADMTLEGKSPLPAETGGGDHIDGYGVSHQCKDLVSFLFCRSEAIYLLMYNFRLGLCY